MSSLSKQERVALEDVFISLGEKESIMERMSEQNNRFISSIKQIVKKSIPLTISLVKSKKNIIKHGLKMDKTQLFNHFRPKNRDSK